MPDLLVRLYDLPGSVSELNCPAAQGIVIRRAMTYEKHAVVHWVKDRFGKGWAGECEVAFSRHPVSCFIATEYGNIVGFACHDVTCLNFFGPTGVAEEKRGTGIGKALLLSCLHAMAAQGYAYAIIGGAGPTQFFVKTAGALPIAGSTPGIYRDRLKTKDINLGDSP
jgi:GNAT superfamily N-acetyltransferase